MYYVTQFGENNELLVKSSTFVIFLYLSYLQSLLLLLAKNNITISVELH